MTDKNNLKKIKNIAIESNEWFLAALKSARRPCSYAVIEINLDGHHADYITWMYDITLEGETLYILKIKTFQKLSILNQK